VKAEKKDKEEELERKKNGMKDGWKKIQEGLMRE